MKNTSSKKEDLELYLYAIELACKAHRGQKRWGGESYFEYHVMPVAMQCHELFGIVAGTIGVLHDVVEDTDWTSDDLTTAGFPDDIVHSVRLLTHHDDMSYAAYIQRMCSCSNEYAMQVKIVDIQCNLADLISADLKKDSGNHKQRIDKYELALIILETALNDTGFSEPIKVSDLPNG